MRPRRLLVNELLLRMLALRPPPSITVTGITNDQASHHRRASKGPAKNAATKVMARIQAVDPAPPNIPVAAKIAAEAEAAITPRVRPRTSGIQNATMPIPITRRMLARATEYALVIEAARDKYKSETPTTVAA
ncbi:MAG TPA: hypothetical protein VFA85_15975 [Terriglobales bacterium]|nr:hypothetical protein [Terriglobales bacterium]